MSFKLPKLPYALDALQPHISKKTLDVHYHKHHQGYVDKLNELVKGTSYEKATLIELITTTLHANRKIFDNAAQVWNHTFFWNCMTANPQKPSKYLQERIQKDFTSMEDLQEKFTEAAKNLFGSGWVWLVKAQTGELAIRSGQNARNPLTEGEIPVLTCDVWEHAYYLDYKNEREKFVQGFWHVVDWQFMQKMLEFEIMGDLEDSQINLAPQEQHM